jgi:hypothetical protein
MSKGTDISYDQLPLMIEYFQKHRFNKPVISVLSRDRGDSRRDTMDSIAFQWDKNYNKNDTFELSSIMSKFMDAFASMPDERRRYFVSEIKKYRDLDNPTAGGISGKNRYKFNKSKIDGKFYQSRRR